MFNKLFSPPKSAAYETVWKNKVQQDRQYNTAQCMLDT